MSAQEAKFRSALIQELSKHGALIRPIETGATTTGFPDVYVCKGTPSFIELKYEFCEGPNWNRLIKFRPGQYRFLLENEEKGGNSFVGIAYTNGFLFMCIRGVDPYTKRPVRSSSKLFLKSIKGNGALLIAWINSFNKGKNNAL